MPVSIFSRYKQSAIVKAPGPDAAKPVPSLALRLHEPPESYPDSIIHTVVGEETLDQISYRYYGREDLWWRIMDANDLHPAPGSDSDELRVFRLQAGDRLIIPPVRAATRFPRG